jgi:hydrogenase/urease accessory protein HupE
MRRALAFMLLFGCFVGRVLAHDIAASFLDLDLKDGSLTIRYRLPVPELDLLFGVDKDLDGQYTAAEIQDAAPRIQQYVNERLSLSADGVPIPFEPKNFTQWKDEGGHLWFDFVKVVPESQPVRQIRMESRLFQDLVATHKTMVAVHADEKSNQYALDSSNLAGEWKSGRVSATEHFVRFLELGIEHIFTGYDHILFLIGLLLIPSTLVEVVKIVTSFTIAHSITLGLAVMGQVNPNPKAVEVGIAFSIAYVGFENLLRHPLMDRWKITGFFGLVHGFGFAHILREMNLSPGELASSLFSFNFGVELGQITIVLLSYPLLKAIRNRPWHIVAVRAGSVTILAFGIVWFFQRMFTAG